MLDRVACRRGQAACPLAYVHSRAEARPDRHPGELTTANARDLMVQVAEFGPPPVFVLTGGDPYRYGDTRKRGMTTLAFKAA